MRGQQRMYSAIASSRILRLVSGACLALLVSAAAAQGNRLVISTVDAHSGLQAPAYIENPTPVEIGALALLWAAVGENIELHLNGTNAAQLTTSAVGNYLNGDRWLRANGQYEGQYISLSLTFGNSTLFAHVYGEFGTRQIYALARQDTYKGWLFAPDFDVSSTGGINNDYRIVDTTLPTAFANDVQALKSIAEPAAVSDSGAVMTSEIDASNFAITQSFGNSYVIAGGVIDAQVTLRNISNATHTNLQVEFYFMLENTQLLSAPAYCIETTSASLQTVLQCEVGDFSPGQEKVFNYTLQTNASSKPSVASTAIIGALRQDSAINVVADIRSDADLDGISDFNEGILRTDPANAESVSYATSTIDVLALYSSGAAAIYSEGVETRINQLFGVANQVFADSHVGIELRPVHMAATGFADSYDMDAALDRLLYRSDPAFASLNATRAFYGADLVMLFRPLEDQASACGLAPVGGFNTQGDFSNPIEREYAVSVIGIDCPTDIVVAHEAGHNLGLTHSYVEDGMGGTFDFATGYGVTGEFATVMAYPEAFNTSTQLARFSDPDADCVGLPCGIEESQEQPADAVTALNLVRHQVAAFYPATVAKLPFAEVSTWSGVATDARVAAGARVEGELGLSTNWQINQSVDLNAEIYVDSNHVGLAGSVHVLIDAGEQDYYLLDGASGVVKWDGEPGSFAALSPLHTLAAVERVAILDDFLVNAALTGRSLNIYIAYLVPELEELVYTTTPLNIDIGN